MGNRGPEATVLLYNCNLGNIFFITSGISTCILCGESFGFFTRQRNLLCADCHRAVCTKCGVESTAAGGKETVWLCKLCSETREMWKKSGAWFFKAIKLYFGEFIFLSSSDMILLWWILF